MTHLHRVLSVWAFWLALGGTALCQPAQRASSLLLVRICSEAGTQLPRGRLVVTSSDGRVYFDSAVKDFASLEVPHGDYKVAFTAPLIRGVTRSVAVHSRRTLVVLATSMELPDFDTSRDPSSVALSVTPTPPCVAGSPMWAKLVGVFSSYAGEQELDSMGFALFERLTPGTYTVAVVDGISVRGLGTVTARGPLTRAELVLSSCRKD